MQYSISIVIPVYNMGDTITKCVRSILENNNDIDIEVIIVDDGSNDNTPQICDELAVKYKNVFVYHKTNEGSGPARNYGIKKASGKYIFFPDADDLLIDNAISIMFHEMKNSDCDLLVFGFQSQTESGKVVSQKKYPYMTLDGETTRQHYSNYIGYEVKYPIQGAPWNKMFDLEIIKKYSIEFPSLRRHQDEAFIARYMCYVESIHFIEDILYIHYTNDLKKEWDKYPVDYIKAVIGLRNDRKHTILKWNKNDYETREWIDCEYICGVIKACELTFSPKANLSFKKRRKRIYNYIKKSRICDFINNSKTGKYQKAILFLAKNKMYLLAYITMHIKISAEKKGIVQLIKTWMR
ncbi:glycosyltransferase family 2 protein [Ruminococcus sp.]|uniref:glycosyltransferase family 2 protein n=1 Tax=Ruminococcus sp. TaxID=41978 RepID=UPI0025DD1831|nr:glycosyltransferase family 2 protein [Ruminococcus sp.]